ncbi:MAG: metal-sulfur cluster assembly factor [Gammaproteobacteria bacterium]|jgi:metal-sulfur cluster biosynthetic enzyme|nr:metal-sulfur cluster assembly factor [Gammaproteobacteria bacterium]
MDSIRTSLQQVIDPEIGINIVDLGLVYDISQTDNQVHVLMTLTSAGCPLQDLIASQMRQQILQDHPDINQVKIEVTFDPPWQRSMMSSTATSLLGG